MGAPGAWLLFIYYLAKLIKLINKNIIYLQKFIFSNFFTVIISKGAINFFRINLITIKYITTVASFYGFIFKFLKKTFYI